jgi:prophage regulatory protein
MSGVHLLNVREVANRVKLGRATIYRMMDLHIFPRPIFLGEKRVAWLAEDIDGWINSRIQERDGRRSSA